MENGTKGMCYAETPSTQRNHPKKSIQKQQENSKDNEQRKLCRRERRNQRESEFASDDGWLSGD